MLDDKRTAQGFPNSDHLPKCIDAKLIPSPVASARPVSLFTVATTKIPSKIDRQGSCKAPKFGSTLNKDGLGQVLPQCFTANEDKLHGCSHCYGTRTFCCHVKEDGESILGKNQTHHALNCDQASIDDETGQKSCRTCISRAENDAGIAVDVARNQTGSTGLNGIESIDTPGDDDNFDDVFDAESQNSGCTWAKTDESEHSDFDVESEIYDLSWAHAIEKEENSVDKKGPTSGRIGIHGKESKDSNDESERSSWRNRDTIVYCEADDRSEISDCTFWTNGANCISRRFRGMGKSSDCMGVNCDDLDMAINRWDCPRRDDSGSEDNFDNEGSEKGYDFDMASRRSDCTWANGESSDDYSVDEQSENSSCTWGDATWGDSDDNDWND